MGEVLFYHLTSAPLESALPELLEKAVGRGMTVRVRGLDRDRMEHLDRHLWSYRDDSFLAHGLSGGPHDARQPVLLTDNADNTNGADLLMLVDGAQEPVASLAGYARVCVMFDGTNPDVLEATRGYWRHIKDSDLVAKYWAQEDGRWVEKG